VAHLDGHPLDLFKLVREIFRRRLATENAVGRSAAQKAGLWHYYPDGASQDVAAARTVDVRLMMMTRRVAVFMDDAARGHQDERTQADEVEQEFCFHNSINPFMSWFWLLLCRFFGVA
jgi:hypothetical protein